MRRVVWFSCGAASAVTARLVVDTYGKADLVFCYCDTGSEHADNFRFLREIEAWLGITVTVLKNAKFENHFDVIKKTGWINGPQGARCTLELKKKLREEFQRPGDIHYLGYTSEERERARRFDVSFSNIITEWILIDRGVTKEDCLGILWKSGLTIPVMYSMGYSHNNCIGCVKGGAGYWNRIRQDFPETFDRMLNLEKEIGASVLKNSDGSKLYLSELPIDRGNMADEPPIICGLGCWVTINSFKESKE